LGAQRRTDEGPLKMSFELPDLRTKVDLDLADFARGCSAGVQQAQSFAGAVDPAMHQKLSVETSGFTTALNVTVAAAAAAAAAITGAFVGIGAIVKGQTDAADKLRDMAIAAGVGVENLSALGLVAQQSGSSTEGVAEAYKFLGRNIAEAAGGSKEAVANFARLGISITDAAGNARPMETVMMDVADAMKDLPAGADRTKAAMDLLGRGGTEMIGTLSQGSSAIREQMDTFREYGAVVTDTAADSADNFNDLLGEVNAAWTGIKMTIAQPIVEALTPALEQLVGFIRSHMPEIRNAVLDTMQAMVRGMGMAADGVLTLVAAYHELHARFLQFKLDSGGFKVEEQADTLARDFLKSQGLSDKSLGPSFKDKTQQQIADAMKSYDDAVGRIGMGEKMAGGFDKIRAGMGDASTPGAAAAGVPAIGDALKSQADIGSSAIGDLGKSIGGFVGGAKEMIGDYIASWMKAAGAPKQAMQAIEDMQPRFAPFVAAGSADAARLQFAIESDAARSSAGAGAAAASGDSVSNIDRGGGRNEVAELLRDLLEVAKEQVLLLEKMPEETVREFDIQVV
jgi:hypothetical protein